MAKYTYRDLEAVGVVSVIAITGRVKKQGGANPRCEICNRFMSWKEVRAAYAWTPYAGALQYELPDEEFAHERCWKTAPESTLRLIRVTAWIPVSHRGKLA